MYYIQSSAAYSIYAIRTTSAVPNPKLSYSILFFYIMSMGGGGGVSVHVERIAVVSRYLYQSIADIMYHIIYTIPKPNPKYILTLRRNIKHTNTYIHFNIT